jgi:DNA-directed RNA polymerase specialized sigma24 family protein
MTLRRAALGAGAAAGNLAPTCAESAERRRARWSALLDRAATGDRAAAAAFYDETAESAFGLITQILKDRDEAEAAMEDFYRDVWVRAAEGEHRHGDPVRWCLGLAQGAALARLNREGMAPLTYQQRAILRLTQYGGLSVQEVSGRLGLSRAVIIQEIRTAVQALRAALA